MLKILSIDLEDWFHILDHPETEKPSQWENFESRIESNAMRLLDILEETNQKATWFCLGWVARKNPSLVKRISETHHIACHSDLHRLVYTQSPAEFKEDTLRAKKDLENLIGKEVNVYRASGFSVTPQTPWFFEMLLECGIQIDSSVFPASRAHGGFPGFGSAAPCRIECQGSTLKEFPMNTKHILGKDFVFSGGGYFRALPYTLIDRFFSESNYVMTYFHPRDFDPDQPVLSSLPMHRKVMSYIGLKSSEKKLRRLLQDHNFVDLPTADKATDWDHTELIML
ncbi:MAG: polysaccharide deacetylase family protein [Bacteroidia bacterium]|nr:polysaccharide deacetylase family protein [Bacteroidia bacterium]